MLIPPLFYGMKEPPHREFAQLTIPGLELVTVNDGMYREKAARHRQEAMPSQAYQYIWPMSGTSAAGAAVLVAPAPTPAAPDDTRDHNERHNAHADPGNRVHVRFPFRFVASAHFSATLDSSLTPLASRRRILWTFAPMLSVVSPTKCKNHLFRSFCNTPIVVRPPSDLRISE